jgi:hypothetical protein
MGKIVHYLPITYYCFSKHMNINKASGGALEESIEARMTDDISDNDCYLSDGMSDVSKQMVVSC